MFLAEADWAVDKAGGGSRGESGCISVDAALCTPLEAGAWLARELLLPAALDALS